MICVPTSATLGARAGISASRLIGSAPPSSPTITAVNNPPGFNDELSVDFSDMDVFDHYNIQTYADAGLTVLVADVNGPTPPATTATHIQGSLSQGTQYWFRVRVSNDGGSMYSGWSNTGTGTTTGSSDPLAGITFLFRGQASQGFGATPQVPLGLFKDNACTIPATTAADTIKGFKDELGGTGGWSLVDNLVGPCSLGFGANGNPYINFTGSSALGLGASQNIPKAWVFIGLTIDDDSSNFSAPFTVCDGTGNPVDFYASPTNTMMGFRGGAGQAGASANYGVLTPRMLAYHWDSVGNVSEVYYDNVLQASGTFTPSTNTGVPALGTRASDTFTRLNGKVSSLLIMTTDPTSGQRATIQTFLSGLNPT